MFTVLLTQRRAATKLRMALELREHLGKAVSVYPEDISHITSFYYMEQVMEHNKQNDLWVVIDNCVYDLTLFVDSHPGGSLALVHAAGHDCTDLFTEYHPAPVWTMMKQFRIGALHPDSRVQLTDFAKDRRKIRQELLARGLFEGRSSYFAFKFFVIFLFFLASVFFLQVAFSNEIKMKVADKLQHGFNFTWFLHEIWSYLFNSPYVCRFLAALFLGLFWQQMAFLGHDAGHNSISHSLYNDSVLGLLIGNLFTGISIGFWKRNHNVHHIVCNSVEHDPDIQHLPFLAISDKIFKPSIFSSSELKSEASVNSEAAKYQKSTAFSKLVPVIECLKDGYFFSTYFQKFFVFDSFAKFMVSYQHYLYYPLMAIARYNLYLQSWVLLISPPIKQAFLSASYRDSKAQRDYFKWMYLELLSLSGFLLWLSFFLYYFLPDWKARVTFVLVSHAVAGILHIQITLSHFACEVYRGSPFSHPDDWFKTQVYTSINVDTSWITSWFHGGLQFQIEHHLFPRLPRHNLPEAKKLVEPFCIKHNIPYRSISFFEANCRVVKALYRTAITARNTDIVDTSMMYESLNAFG